MHKSLTFTALSTIKNTGVDLTALFETLLANGYGATAAPKTSMGQRIKDRRSLAAQELLRFRETKKRCRALLNKLEQKCYIQQQQKNGRIVVRLTPKGVSHLAHIREKQAIKETPLAERTKNAHWIIVVFDIPEEKRSKRNWIRRVLHTMGFVMLQRSVWASQTILPKAFADKIATQGLAPHVKIIETADRGNFGRLPPCARQ